MLPYQRTDNPKGKEAVDDLLDIDNEADRKELMLTGAEDTLK